MKSKSEKEKIELKKRLARVLRVPANKTCADCPETRPTWISFIKPQQNFALGSKVLASFVCLECAGLHRKLGTHVCVVRSISHDQFEDKDVDCAEYSGNDVVNEIFEGHLQKSTMDGINIKPLLGAEVARRERFIRQKYVDLYFYRKRAHYQHIAEVNKMVSNTRKTSKSPGSKSSPMKFRKKLSNFFHDDSSLTSENDAKMSGGCSTTVGNTTITRTNTSRTRTITDRDDSNKSATPKKDKKSKKRLSSKSGKTSKNRKKGKKKSSSKRRLKAKDQSDPMFDIPSDILPEGGAVRIGETSAPQKQPNTRKDLKLKGSANIGTIKRNSKDSDDLSGMILVFDEDSCESFDTPQREHNRSSRDLDRGRRKNTINTSSSEKPTVDSSNDQNDHSKEFFSNPIVKSTSESYDSRDPLATTLRDVRRSRSEITIDEITKIRDSPISPGFNGKKKVGQNSILGPSLQIIADQCSTAEKAKVGQKRSSSVRKSNLKLPYQGDGSQLKAHLKRDASKIQNMSARNLKNPYLESAPMSPISVEGIISEEASYGFGFGDNTVNNMSGTGEDNPASSTEDNITEDGFRMINSETVNDLSYNCKEASWESRGAFSLPYKNKKATDGAIKNQSGRRYSGSMAIALNRPDDYHEINKSSRSIGNRSSGSIGNKSNRSRSNKSSISFNKKSSRSNKSSRSISNKSDVSFNKKSSKKKSSKKKKSNRSSSNKSDISFNKESNRSVGNKSNMSISNNSDISFNKSNRSNMSIGVDEPLVRTNSRRPKNQAHVNPDPPLSNKNRSSKRRSKRSSSKSNKNENKLNQRNQALLDEWMRLKSENQKKLTELDHNFSRVHAQF